MLVFGAKLSLKTCLPDQDSNTKKWINKFCLILAKTQNLLIQFSENGEFQPLTFFLKDFDHW